jgi:nitroreductase
MSGSADILAVIKSRRVIRNMTGQEVAREQIESILEAGRWAPSAGNQRTNRFTVIQNPTTLNLLRLFSPGMYQLPQAVILICVDQDVVAANQFPSSDMSPFIDVGATMQTMMLAAHGLGIGSGPVTSFSKEAVKVILNLPPNLSPEMMICVGYAAPKGESQLPMRKKGKTTWQSLTHWERYRD